MLAILIISVIVSIISVGALVSGIVILSRKTNQLEAVFGGKHVRAAAGRSKKLQRDIDQVTTDDFNNFINTTPVLLEMFPDAIPTAIAKKATPHFLNSLIKLGLPAIRGLMSGGTDGAVQAAAGAALSTETVVPLIVKFFEAISNNAKNRATNNPKTTNSATPKQKVVHQLPQVVAP